jgi:hypothetical protein
MAARRAVLVVAVCAAELSLLPGASPAAFAALPPQSGVAYQDSTVRHYWDEQGSGSGTYVATQYPTKFLGYLRLGGKSYLATLEAAGFSCRTPDLQPCGTHTVALSGTVQALPTTTATPVGGTCAMPFSGTGLSQISCSLELQPPAAEVATYSVTLQVRHTAQVAVVDGTLDDTNATLECFGPNDFGGCTSLLPGPLALPYNSTFEQL